MTKTYFDITGIKLDATGRVELADADLPELVNNGGLVGGNTNFDEMCQITPTNPWCFATNPSCNNENNCQGDTNTLTCSNGFLCKDGANGYSCSNQVGCQSTVNAHACTNTFGAGCSGSSNLNCN